MHNTEIIYSKIMQITLKSQMAESKQMLQPSLSALPSFTSLNGLVI